MVGGLQERGAAQRPLARGLPVRDGARRQHGAREVMGDDLRLALGQLREALRQQLGDPRVQGPPAPAQHARVRRVLQQRVRELEPARGALDRPDHLVRGELRERAVERHQRRELLALELAAEHRGDVDHLA